MTWSFDDGSMTFFPLSVAMSTNLGRSFFDATGFTNRSEGDSFSNKRIVSKLFANAREKRFEEIDLDRF